MTTLIEFFFDFSSTYIYVASERIDQLTGNAPQHIAWIAFTLAPSNCTFPRDDGA